MPAGVATGISFLAAKYQNEALETMIQGTLTAPFIIPDNELVKWANAHTFTWFGIKIPGMRNKSRDGSGISSVNNVDNFEQTFTITHEREVSPHIDKLDQDATGNVVNAQTILDKFIEEQWNPEIDAVFFSKVATEAIAVGNFSATDVSTYTADNVYPRLKAIISSSSGQAKLRRYRQKGRLIMYIVSELMDLLEQSTQFNRKIEVTNIMGDGASLETRITSFDSITVIEVIDDERFYTAFDFEPTDEFLSFEAAVGSFKLNVLVAAVGMTRTVPKFQDIYFYPPGTVQGINGTVMDIFPFWDTFVFKNNIKGGVIDHIFIDRDTTAVV